MSAPSEGPVIAGAEAMSHVGERRTGVLVLHGFTGTPASLRGVATALADAGHHIELPRLPGHGTTVADLLATSWSDWSAAAVDAYDRLASRADAIVVIGFSMGGALALRTAFDRPVAAVMCINPVTRPQPPEVREMLEELIDDGVRAVPAGGADTADPAAVVIAYDTVPVGPLLSLSTDGLAPMTDRFGELTAPLLLLTSREDHVVEPGHGEHLAATYGGEVDHRWLEHSYHDAPVDHDRDLIVACALQFAAAADHRVQRPLAPSATRPAPR